MRLRPLAFATFLVWWLRIGACGVGACGFWRLWHLPRQFDTIPPSFQLRQDFRYAPLFSLKLVGSVFLSEFIRPKRQLCQGNVFTKKKSGMWFEKDPSKRNVRLPGLWLVTPSWGSRRLPWAARLPVWAAHRPPKRTCDPLLRGHVVFERPPLSWMNIFIFYSAAVSGVAKGKLLLAKLAFYQNSRWSRNLRFYLPLRSKGCIWALWTACSTCLRLSEFKLLF